MPTKSPVKFSTLKKDEMAKIFGAVESLIQNPEGLAQALPKEIKRLGKGHKGSTKELARKYKKMVDASDSIKLMYAFGDIGETLAQALKFSTIFQSNPNGDDISEEQAEDYVGLIHQIKHKLETKPKEKKSKRTPSKRSDAVSRTAPRKTRKQATTKSPAKSSQSKRRPADAPKTGRRPTTSAQSTRRRNMKRAGFVADKKREEVISAITQNSELRKRLKSSPGISEIPEGTKERDYSAIDRMRENSFSSREKIKGMIKQHLFCNLSGQS